VAKRRKVANILALAVLSVLVERPMHPYEMATVLRDRGKDNDMKINWGSLYTVVQNLEKHGFIETAETIRQGRRPERTVYGITAAGRDELQDWVRELVGEVEREYPRFEAALSMMGALPPDEALPLLERRLELLEADIAGQQAGYAEAIREVPRFFLVEVEYRLAMRRAEAAWLRGLLAEIADGALSPGVELWREFHAKGPWAQGEGAHTPD
jgi:DNA-binding PadR family transcriptional regulator